jgi:hypothetical protein
MSGGVSVGPLGSRGFKKVVGTEISNIKFQIGLNDNAK